MSKIIKNDTIKDEIENELEQAIEINDKEKKENRSQETSTRS